MKNKTIDDVIIESFADLCALIKLGNASNLQDRNIYSEEFVGHLLNLVFSYDLKNLNTYEDQNIAGIDLGDATEKLAIQVTSTDLRNKVVSTIEKFESNHLGKGYDKLKVVLLRDCRPNFRGEFQCNGHEFSKEDILSLAEIHKLISQKGVDERQVIADFLEDWFNTDSTTKITAETYVLKKFFRDVASFNDTIEDQTDPINHDDLLVKKERFADFWQHVQQVYGSIFDARLEATFTRITGSLPQGDRDKIRLYLKYRSTMMLSYEQDPTKIIDGLKQTIMQELNVRFISEAQVVNFLYYHFFRCNVLPNPVLEEVVA